MKVCQLTLFRYISTFSGKIGVMCPLTVPTSNQRFFYSPPEGVGDVRPLNSVNSAPEKQKCYTDSYPEVAAGSTLYFIAACEY